MGPLKTPKRSKKKAAAKKRGKKSMARKKVVRRKVRRRRNARTSVSKRKAAARKGARTRAAKKAARSKAAKKAARTRKRRTAAPRRARRKNPSRKRKTTSRRRTAKKATRKRRRRSNPRGVNANLTAMRAEAKRRGLKASGSLAQIQARIAAQDRRLRGGSKKKRKTTKRKGKRKMTKAASLRKARRARRVSGKHSRSAKAVIRRSKGKSRNARQRRGVARAYMRTRSVVSRAKKGHLTKDASKMARVYGLTRVNPGFKSIMKDWKVMIPMGAIAGGALLGMTWAGFKAADFVAKKVPAETLAKIPGSQYLIPALPGIGALLATTAVYTFMRSRPKIGGVNIGRFAGPVMLGGSAAAVLLIAMNTAMGKNLMKKSGIVLAAHETPEKQAADAANTQGGLGSYLTVSRYMGGLGASQEISAQGPSWYGRGDISGFVASDYPVHTPGPGDDDYTMAQLGEGGIFGDYVDASPQNRFGGFELEQTPGGTVIEMGEAGIFGGKGVI